MSWASASASMHVGANGTQSIFRSAGVIPNSGDTEDEMDPAPAAAAAGGEGGGAAEPRGGCRRNRRARGRGGGGAPLSAE